MSYYYYAHLRKDYPYRQEALKGSIVTARISLRYLETDRLQRYGKALAHIDESPPAFRGQLILMNPKRKQRNLDRLL